jgi:DNA-binding NarL/FixJ family response regulator
VLRGVDDLVAMSLALYLRSEGLLAQRHAARSRDGILTAAATMNPGVVLLDLDLGRGPEARSSTAPRSSLDSAAPAGASPC